MHHLTRLMRVCAWLSLFGSAVASGRVNLALHQAVVGSTQNGTYAAEYAVDGMVSNFQSFRTADTANPHWLEVRFAQAVTIASAHVYCGLNNALSQRGLSSFQFQFEQDGSWINIPGSQVTGNTDPERRVTFSTAITTRRIRLYTTDTGNRVIRELALFGPNVVGVVEQGYTIGTGVRLSLGHQRPALASAIAGAAYPKLAVDGYIGGDAGWIASGDSQTLEIDLLADHALGSAHVYSGTQAGAAMADFVLETLSGSTWQPIPGASISGNTAKELVIAFTTPVTATRLRLRTASASAAPVRELVLFPPRSQPYPLAQDVRSEPAPAAVWEDFSDSMWGLRNSGPDLRLAVVDSAVVFGRALDGVAAIEWQLLLNYRDGSYRIRHSASGLCLALAQVSAAAETPVVAETYSALPHQDWWVDWVSSDEFRLINVFSGLAVQSASGSAEPHAPLVARAPDDSDLQRWQAIEPRHQPKKGLATTGAKLEGYNTLFPSAWSYTWGRQQPSQFPFLAADHIFNPMQWGNFNWTHGGNGPLEYLGNTLQSSALPVNFMGFNEPDKSEQANMSAALALQRWPRLEALNVPLVSPAPANALGGWLAEFYAGAQAQGLRSDYTAVHWYANPNATSLINHLQSVYTAFGKPVWLTEFSVVRWSGTTRWTHAANYNFLAEFMWRAEALPWLKRYSLFHFIEGPSDNPNQSANDPAEAPRSNSIRADGSLTPFGELYAGWDGVAAVLPYKVYHIHNRGGYQRVFNSANAAVPTLVDPDNSTSGSHWILLPGVTPDTYRIVSVVDGRPLAWCAGSGMGLGVPGQLATAFEWRLVADQHGWVFLQHPQTNQRLRHNSDGTYSMAATTSTGDAFKWRFVVPAVATGLPEYAGWAQTRLASLPAGQQLPQADADQDGLPNWLEFVFGSDPLVPNPTYPQIPKSDGGGYDTLNPARDGIYVEFPWSADATGHTWRFRTGSDLAGSSLWPVIEPLSAAVSSSGGRSVIRVELPVNLEAPAFFRLEVQ